MERMSRLCVAVLVLVVLKFSLPCPEECFEWEKNSRNNCQCPRQHVEITMKCYSSRGQAVAANSVCSAENQGLTCLNGVPTGFNQSVIGIHLNNLFNLTTLTKHDIPPLRSLIRLNIIGSTIQTIEAGAFSSVPAIQWITIKCSRLQHIGDATFANLSKLKGIFLYYNLIEPTENIRKTTSACTEQAKKTTSGIMDSTRSITLEKNLDDGQQSRTDYIYIPIGLTVGVIVLLGGTAVAVIMYKRHVSKGRQNPVHGQQGVIISTQLISNRMYQPSGSATGDDRDKEETDETEEGSARQNPVNKRHKVIIDTSLLISNQMYTSSASSANSANQNTLMTEETEEDSARQNPVHKLHGFTIDTSQMISNRMYKTSASSANSANQDTETIEGPEENSELTPYLTVPLDAINNDLRIEPYSSVDLDDISSNEEMNDDLHLAPSPEHQDEDDMEPYVITPLDQIGDP
ncbi:PREDICTED: uncharacterized protein LOC109468455 [Branchiostoma belcheri]|uniref:Uncharacterized protein LOC109468455 n=1 Tax=Branchiostoma belcheri TaxID=7741 RepID=A0A6P4YCV3_BRABE|nr:PREDICTED: uncharacterized protein LOC109468455 [Branchiostoma belcheri]